MGVSWPRCLQIHDTFYFQTKLLKGKYSPDFEIWHSPEAIELIYDRPHFSASSVYEVSSKAHQRLIDAKPLFVNWIPSEYIHGIPTTVMEC